MPVIPIRSLSKFGVINDVDPYNLPTEAWSMGVNVRFKNLSILRAPVFRSVNSSMSFTSPRFVASLSPTTGFDSVILGYLNGRVTSYKSGAETDISISGYVNANAEAPFTSAHLADVFYTNRSDRVPWYKRTSDTIMQTLATGLTGAWPSNYMAQLLRSCSSALIAFGVTKAGISFPTMVKTSEFAAAGTIPANWDPTVTGTNATENTLAEMEGAIIDANNLGEIMMIYGLNETWTMTADGSTNIWVYHRVWTDAGAINANCSVEVNRLHYVFGPTDIWMHDGTTKKSICDQRTRDFIFSALNLRNAYRCFVVHNQNLKEIYFCFMSGDAYTGFVSGPDGCNRCAVYNYVDNVWSYYDLPYVYGGSRTNLDNSQTYATTTAIYSTVGGTYLSQDDSVQKCNVWAGDANTTYGLSQSLYAFDLQGPGSIIALPVDTNATLGWSLYRDGIDLDELGVDLKGYKVINSIYPQARLEAGAQPITFVVGANDYFNDGPYWDAPQTYDGDTLYKLDFNMAGRYLSVKITHADWHFVNFTGLDIDLDVLGER